MKKVKVYFLNDVKEGTIIDCEPIIIWIYHWHNYSEFSPAFIELYNKYYFEN
jgi:hypothetical protein